MTPRWPGPSYELRAEFRAPLEFVYRWCTDFTPQDAKLEGEEYTRRILERSARRVVYEDLTESKGGWIWARHDVHLDPPDHWHSDSVGSHREYWLDYRLSRLPDGRTRMVLRARRRPTSLGAKNPPAKRWADLVGLSWVRFGRAIEREYRRKPRARVRRA